MLLPRRGLPEYRAEKPWGVASAWSRWRCRRRGGHFGPVEQMVDGARSSILCLCCSECRGYLGPIYGSPITDPPLLEEAEVMCPCCGVALGLEEG